MATFPISLKDVGALVREKDKLFQPEGSRIPGDPRYENRPTNATPTNMKLVLDQLDAYTKAVQEAAKNEGMTSDDVVQQWQNDMANWQFRLAHYYQALAVIPVAERDTVAGADLIYFNVTSPLLDGVYYQVLPGIVLNEEEKTRMALGPPDGFSNDKPPDVATPFMLGNQVVVYRNHQTERWDQLWADLAAGAKRLGAPEGEPNPLAVLTHVLVTVGSALIGGGITYLGVQGYNLKRRHDAARQYQQMRPPA
jgi:hypothetical protein